SVQEKLATVIARLDIRRAQVLVEAIIVEVLCLREEKLFFPGCVRNVKPGVYAICWVRLEVEKPGWRSNCKKINIAV
ncbi:hypothetical protein AB0U66_20700, partial [Escherichia coli]